MDRDGSDMECSEEDDFEDYYKLGSEDCDVENFDQTASDPEHFSYECLRTEDVEKLFNELVEELSSQRKISPSLAKVLLHTHQWSLINVPNCSELKNNDVVFKGNIVCPVCYMSLSSDCFCGLNCGHVFCKDCWTQYCEVQIKQGVSSLISCMANDCSFLAPEDFVLNLLVKPKKRNKYQWFAFRDYVQAHPQLRFCPGVNCPVIVRASSPCAKRVTCAQCKSTYCFKCGSDYHAPTDCSTIRKWLTKCADDSETANYISAHTKDCPRCHICIEKNGGCNHMQCFKCKFDFCWMCLGEWKTHGAEYYECSRYKENPNVSSDNVHAQAREALKKYLHYYERWENHSKSLKLEEQTLEKIKAKINTKVMNSSGTWIDWQYLLTAASLLAKCRYTLQYTYPFAYYMEAGARKELFEYQQAGLEAEIENLSWKIERAESTDRGDLENQMDIAEKRRVTLLKDFLES